MEANKIIKGSLSTVILQLLQNNGKMYGYEITKAVRDGSRGEMQITEAALYPCLHRLEAEGFLNTETMIAEGRLRKYYKLNRAGKKAVALQIEALQGAIKSLQRVLKFEVKNS